MQLRDHLEQLSQSSESYFRRALAAEDIGRIDRLIALFAAAEDKAAFMKEGRFIGWTQNDMTTYRLTAEIDNLLEAIYARQSAETISEAHEKAVGEAWIAFNTARMEKLIHCL